MKLSQSEKRSFLIILSVIASEGAVVLFIYLQNKSGFISFLQSDISSATSILIWSLTILIAVGYVYGASIISDVKKYMFSPSLLKVVAIIAAVVAASMEELIFRKVLMDALQKNNYSVFIQIFLSGLAFGLIHLIWGVKNFSAGLGAAFFTMILGWLMAILYILGDRNFIYCFIGHFIVTALIEPGLIHAAVTNKLGLWGEKT